MKIRCLNNQYDSLPIDIKEKKRPSVFSIAIDQKYIVYAITEYYGHIWYFILGTDFDYMWRPSSFFEIVDARLSRFWVFSLFDKLEEKKKPFWGIPEWARDEIFYDNLIEGDEEEVNIFRRYRQAMDLEFPDESVTENAQIGDETWLMCPECIDAWEYPDDRDALVICPKCLQKYNNPRYKNELPKPLEKGIYFDF